MTDQQVVQSNPILPTPLEGLSDTWQDGHYNFCGVAESHIVS